MSETPTLAEKIENFLRLNIVADCRDQARVELDGLIRAAYLIGVRNGMYAGWPPEDSNPIDSIEASVKIREYVEAKGGS